MKYNRRWWQSPAFLAAYVGLLALAVYAPEVAALCGYGELDCTTRKLKASQHPNVVDCIEGASPSCISHSATGTVTRTFTAILTSTDTGTGVLDRVAKWVSDGTLGPSSIQESYGGVDLLPVGGENPVLRLNGAATGAAIIYNSQSGSGQDRATFAVNSYYDGTSWYTFNGATPSWLLQLRTDEDDFSIHRAPAGSSTFAQVLSLDSVGNLGVPGFVTGSNAWACNGCTFGSGTDTSTGTALATGTTTINAAALSHTHTATDVPSAVPWPPDGCGSCYCSGTGPTGALTVRCGAQACGSDYHLYDCTAGGWVYEGTACGEQTPSCVPGYAVDGILAGTATGTGTERSSYYVTPAWAISGGSFGSGTATATTTSQGQTPVTINVTSTASNANTLYAQNGITLGTTSTVTATQTSTSTATPTITVTNTVTTSSTSAAVSANPIIGSTRRTVVKSTDFSTTYENDSASIRVDVPELQFTVEASATYHFHAELGVYLSETGGVGSVSISGTADVASMRVSYVAHEYAYALESEKTVYGDSGQFVFSMVGQSGMVSASGIIVIDSGGGGTILLRIRGGGVGEESNNRMTVKALSFARMEPIP